MAEIIRLVCDKCESETEVGQYRLSTPETGLLKAKAFDLCADCAKPLHEFESMGRTVSRSKRATGRYRPGRGGEAIRSTIYTQEELDKIEDLGEA